MIRVTLHRAGELDYIQLHEAMETAYFVRTIRGDNGTLYHLPRGHYRYSTRFFAMTPELVRKKAMNVIAITGRRYSILVSEVLGSAWFNMEVIEE